MLSNYKGTRYLVLGDMGELGETAIQHHIDAGESAKSAGINNLFTIGELSLNAAQSFGSVDSHFESYAELEKELLEVLDENTTVLIKGSRYMQMDKVVGALLEEQE